MCDNIPGKSAKYQHVNWLPKSKGLLSRLQALRHQALELLWIFKGNDYNNVQRVPRWNEWLNALGVTRLFQKLSAVPYGYYPDNIRFDAIKEPKRWNKHFSKGKVRKFRQYSAGPWKFTKS